MRAGAPGARRAFILEGIELARRVQHGPKAGEREDRLTAMQWLTNLRCFFADVYTWGAELGRRLSLTRRRRCRWSGHDLRNLGFDKVRRRAKARVRGDSH